MIFEKLQPFQVPGSFVRLGLMRGSSLEEAGKEYAMSSAGSAGRLGAAYNLSAVGVVAMVTWLWLRDGWAPRALAAFVAVSFVIGVAVDPEPFARKLSLTDLVPQLLALGELLLRWLKETGASFVLMFVSFVCIASSGYASALWHPMAFWVAYLGWIAVRIVYFGHHMWGLRQRWERMEPPFVIHCPSTSAAP